MQRHIGGNLAMHLSIFEVRTWNFDTWFEPSSPKQYLASSKKTKTADIRPAKRFPWSWNGRKVNGFSFCFLSSPSSVSASLFWIACQNFRSELEKLSGAQRYWSISSALAGPACTTFTMSWRRHHPCLLQYGSSNKSLTKHFEFGSTHWLIVHKLFVASWDFEIFFVGSDLLSQGNSRYRAACTRWAKVVRVPAPTSTSRFGSWYSRYWQVLSPSRHYE